MNTFLRHSQRLLKSHWRANYRPRATMQPMQSIYVTCKLLCMALLICMVLGIL